MHSFRGISANCVLYESRWSEYATHFKFSFYFSAKRNLWPSKLNKRVAVVRSLLEVLDDPVGVVLDVGVHAGQVAGAAVRRSEADDAAEDVRRLVAVEMHQRAAAVRRA